VSCGELSEFVVTPTPLKPKVGRCGKQKFDEKNHFWPRAKNDEGRQKWRRFFEQ